MIAALRRTWNRLSRGFLRRHSDRDLSEEMRSHLQFMVDDLVRSGLTLEEARRRARLQFGSVDAATESYRDQRGLPIFDTLAQDVRYALRGIGRNPGFAAVAILSLGIGIGANTAIFSLVNGVLLQPLAFREPEGIFGARELLPILGGAGGPVNPMHALEWARRCPSLEHVALIRSGRGQLTGNGEPASVRGIRVSANLFTLLGVEPIRGRAFLPGEDTDGNAGVIMIAESLWRSRFNADPSLVGTSIIVDEAPYQVVGIVPAWFRLPYNDNGEIRYEIFRPLVVPQAERTRASGNFNYAAIVRVRRGATAERALAEMNVVEAELPRQLSRELRAALIPVHSMVTGRARAGLWMLASAVGAVLLIVCVNLANLLLSRVAARRREAAIRAALGASRGRQFRQVLTESLLLAAMGGAAGVLLAAWAVRFLVSTSFDIPRLHEVQPDGTVLLFSLGLTIVSGLVFGALPAWRFTQQDPQEALRAGSHTVSEGRSGLRLRELLIGLEVGLSAALLIVAALLSSSLTRLLHVEKGFDGGRVLTFDVDLPGSRFADADVRDRFYDSVLARISANGGVQAAGLITQLPTRGETWNDPIYLEDGERFPVNNRYASPGYFSAMNISMRRGRGFDEHDRGRGVAVLSEKAVRLLWPGEPDPLGRQFMGEDDTLKTLVGIVADVRASLNQDAPPTAYYPYWQRVPGGATFVIRTTDLPGSAAGLVRDAVHAEDAQTPLQSIRTMDEVVGDSVGQRRFQATLMTAFAASALLVASLGIYGVVSYAVTRRRNEIGIRVALGAQQARLLVEITRQSMTPVVAGLAGGIGVALLAGRTIQGLLFGIQASDPLTIAGVAVVLLAVGVMACVIPARRAAGMDAVAALRLD